MTETFLNDIWSVYYHDPYSTDWTMSSYKFICNISSVESYCKVMKTFNDIWKYGGFFIMREHITPRWEDDYNVNGGCYSIKVNASDFNEKWFEMCASVLGETLAKEDILNVNGISSTPKMNSYIVRIWLKDNNKASREFYNIPCCKFSSVMYKKHKE